MKAIRTIYFGPGNVRGSRVKATDEDGNSVTIPYDSALSSDAAHDAAALALCQKMGWEGILYRGALKRGNVYVWAYPEDKVVVRFAEQANA